MKSDFKIFIGWDFAQSEAAEICAESIRRFTKDEVPIQLICRDVLSMRGLYWREQDPGQSTDFAFTRFLTPYLANYRGTALFCDADFFWRKDPREILQYQDEYVPVQVVQHQISEARLASTKMCGVPQKWYPKKNWSSLMLFNCEHNLYRLNKLNPISVSEASPAWLHQFEWFEEIESYDSLPLSFNHLADYGYPERDPHAVHFTDGGPWLDKRYESAEFADEWLAFRSQFATRDIDRV